MSDVELIGAENREVGERVREELARRRLSRQALADMARISLSTLEKALAGTRPFTLASTIRLEEALGTSLRRAPAAASGTVQQAPDSMGAYTRAAVHWIEGTYFTLRPSFSTAGNLYSYLTTIRWLDDAGHLGFAESKRQDAHFEQAGYVSMPNLSGHIYLVTNEAGQHRLIMLGRPSIVRPSIGGTMYGILTTLQVGQGSQLVPAACPVALISLDRMADPLIGSVEPGAAQFAEYSELLANATRQDYARFHL
jgi:transcriptional regulator with XRE-family HTH domain